MAEHKKLRRLATSGTVQFDGAVNVVKLESLDEGGEFDLYPFASEGEGGTRVYFPAPNAPAYGVAIEGDIESLGRFARAILALERKAKDEEPAAATA